MDIEKKLNCTKTRPSCSKLTTLLVKVLLKFQMLISQIGQYFLLKKFEKLLQCKSFSHFFNKKYQYTVQPVLSKHLRDNQNLLA